jgi:alpha-tubulin suppressor-like RCC1 family protein
LQWYFNNSPLVDGGRISGSTNATLNIANIVTNDAGNYQLVASNVVGVTTSSIAILTPVILPPFFVQLPVSQSVVGGSNVTFTAVVDGTAPYGYQWSFAGSPLADDARINGSTTPSLSISNLTTADAGGYTVTVTNVAGSTNTTVVLTVLVPPSITLNPIGRSVPPGLPTIFTANASGISTPGYQWQLNGTNLPGATSKNYTNPAVGINDLGYYQVVASNSVGVTTSSVAQLTFGPVAAWGRNLNNECLPPPGLSNVFTVAGNFGASFALRADGTVAAWGSGSATNIPASASNVVAIATSPTGNYALRSDGRVIGWNGISIPILSNIVAVVAGNNFGYGLRAEGTLTNWGSLPTPGFPAGLNHLTGIAAGYNNAIALRNDGTIVVSGSSAVTNIPGSVTNVIAIAAGYTYAMALRADGKVVAWGSGTITNLPAGMTNIVAISAGNSLGENFGVAIPANGGVIAWGDNTLGETNPPAALTNLVSIAGSAAPFHGLALVNDGSPVIIHPPIGLTTYVGRDVTLHGDAAGAQPLSYQWLLNGTNLPGATDTSLIISNVQLANAGSYQLFVSNNVNTALSIPAPLTVLSNNTLTILSQSTVSPTNLYQGGKGTISGVTVLGNGPLRYQWFFSPTNKNYTAVPGATNDTLVLDPALAINTGNYYVAISNQFSGITNTPAFLRVLFAKAWGYLATDPPTNLVVSNAIAIAVGNAGQGSSLGHYLVLKSDGKISSWTTATSTAGETNFSALSNSIVTAIAAGYQDSLALKSDGTVYAAGYNVYGETAVPAGLNSVIAIACGDYHDLALKSDGTILGWGQNTFLQTSNTAATNVVAIATGGQSSMALRADGSVVTWGAIQPQVPSSATNIIAVSVGGQHYLALRANGTVVGWGNNSFGQTTFSTNLTNIVAISAAGNHSTLLRNDGTVVTVGAFNGQTTITPPADLANVIAIAGSGDHDLALFGTRAPSFTVQPWNRTVFNTTTSVLFAAKCAGVQPVRFQWQLNGTNLPAGTNDTLTVTGKLPKEGATIQSGIYQLIVSNSYGVVASKFAKLTVLYPLGEAMDATNLTWTTTGTAPWFGQTNVTHDGVDAARSGGIGALQETIMQATVIITNAFSHYSFWWKVSSELDFDFLEFRLNGIVQTSISGEVDWQQVNIPASVGTNVLQWRYSKDFSFDAGQDAGWVDQFAVAIDAPVILVQPQPAVQTINLGTNVSLTVTASGAPQMKFQWRQNGNLVGGNSSTLALNNVSRAQSGTYFVTVTNAGGSVISSNVVVQVLVPQILGSPVLLPDGTLQLTSTDANGGLLSPANLANFEAQASTNMIDWVTLPSALSLTNGMLQLQDATRTNFIARYYRIVEH